MGPNQQHDGRDREPMENEELLALVAEEVVLARRKADLRRDDRATALAYFNGELPGPPCDEDLGQGMSSIVSTDVQDSVFAVCAEILPAFSGAAPVEFSPLDEQDEEGAETETRAVNHVAGKAGFYLGASAAIQDAMLYRAGVLKVSWEERTAVEYATADDVPLEMLPEILQAAQGESIDVLGGEIDEESGTASTMSRRYRKSSRPRIDAIPPDEFLIGDDVQENNPDENKFLAHLRPMTRSELIELGFDRALVDEIPPTSTAFRSDVFGSQPSGDNDLRTAHESTDFITVCESYYRIDCDGDGIAELRRVVTAGGLEGTEHLLDNEPWDQQPFCIGVGYLASHRWDGVSLFDRLRMIQDTKTDLIRDIRNITKRAVRQQRGILIGDGDPDDAAESQMGGLVRCRTPGGIFALPSEGIPQEAFMLLQQLDTMRRDKGGGAIDATSGAQAVGQGGDWSIERMMGAIEQLNAMVAKNLCETLCKGVFLKLHRLLRQYNTDPLTIPGSTGWTETRPEDWPMREDMVVATGMSVGERGRRGAALSQLSQIQEQDTQNGKGGILVDLNGQYQTRIDLARLAGLPNPEQYFVNPASPQSQQAQQAQAQQAQQAQEALQAQAQAQQQFQLSLLTSIEQIKAESKLQVTQLQEAGKARDAEMQAAIDVLSERVKLVGIEADVDEAEAKREIDELQATGQLGPNQGGIQAGELQ